MKDFSFVLRIEKDLLTLPIHPRDAKFRLGGRAAQKKKQARSGFFRSSSKESWAHVGLVESDQNAFCIGCRVSYSTGKMPAGHLLLPSFNRLGVPTVSLFNMVATISWNHQFYKMYVSVFYIRDLRLLQFCGELIISLRRDGNGGGKGNGIGITWDSWCKKTETYLHLVETDDIMKH